MAKNKHKTVKKRNPAARALRTNPAYKQKVAPNKKDKSESREAVKREIERETEEA